MKRTPMKRTAWMRAASTTSITERNREQRLTDRALRAMKNAATFEISKSGKNHGPALVSSAVAATNSVANVSTTSTRGARPHPKSKAQRNSHLRDMARGMPCLLLVPGVCCHDRTTVVCCHSNLSIHGKAGARKADDHYSVWGCVACHRWLDQGPAAKAQKYSAFMAAHLRQVLEWRAIAFDTTSAPRDRNAALWALERLKSIPNPKQVLYL